MKSSMESFGLQNRCHGRPSRSLFLLVVSLVECKLLILANITLPPKALPIADLTDQYLQVTHAVFRSLFLLVVLLLR